MIQINWNIMEVQTLKKRESNSNKMTLDEGSYVVVPITSGALLQKIQITNVKKGLNRVNTKTVQIQDIFKHESAARHYYCNTVYDVFRKIDLAINGIL